MGFGHGGVTGLRAGLHSAGEVKMQKFVFREIA